LIGVNFVAARAIGKASSPAKKAINDQDHHLGFCRLDQGHFQEIGPG